jgi:DNA-directed RNA polymerase specialized sigma subunit
MPLRDDYFPKTEGLLYRYMRQKAGIERLEIELHRIEKDILVIEDEIGNLERNFSIPEQPFSSNYGEVYAKTQSSYPERYIEKYGQVLEKLETKLTHLNKRRIQVKVKIMNKQESIRAIDIIVSGMTEEQKQIIEMKYADKMSNYQIGARMVMSEFTIRRKRAEIVDKVAGDLGLIK